MTPEEEFVEIASPHNWLRTADNLHAQAVAMRNSFGRSITTHFDHRARTSRTLDDANKTVFLLGAFALENAIKAFLVYENPHLISNGSLSKNLRSHSLIGLKRLSREVPFKKRFDWVLEGFEEGIDSWARYPCALKVETTRPERVLYDELWSGYLTVMAAYGNKLCRLLSAKGGWSGPHGFQGNRWLHNGEMLGGKSFVNRYRSLRNTIK